MSGPIQGNGYQVWRARYGTVNVKDYGAVGDGVHDDTAAIQAALDVGGPIYFPPGTYLVSKTLTVTVNGTQIIGADQTVKWFNNDTVVIQPASPFTGSEVISVTADYVTVSGLTISRADTTLTIPAYIATGTGDSLYRVNVTNLGGVEWTGATRFVAEDVTVAYTGTYGFNLQSATIGFLNRCNATPNGNNSGPVSYNLASSESVNISNSEANGTPDYALVMDSTNDSEFYDFEGNGASTCQIWINGCNDIGFTRTYLDSGSNHWHIQNSTSIQIIGAYCIGSNGYGVLLDGTGGACHGVHILGGTFDSASSSASVIEVQQTNYNHVIMGNRLNGGKYGIDDQNANAYGRQYIGNDIQNGVNYGSNVGGMVLALNQGYNPVGLLTAPSIPTSGTALTNPFPVTVQVIVTGGTVSNIAINGTDTGLTSGMVLLGPGQTITLTYSAAPAWTWFGL